MFEYIKGIKNTLADTMSRLIEIDPQIGLFPEEDGFQFGYYAFDILPPIKVSEINEDPKGTSGEVQNFSIGCKQVKEFYPTAVR